MQSLDATTYVAVRPSRVHAGWALMLFGLILATVASPAAAQVVPQCPIATAGGEGQAGDAGSRLPQALAVEQRFGTLAAIERGGAPSSTTFTWVVTTQNATFGGNNQSTIVTTVPVTDLGNGTYVARAEQFLDLGDFPGEFVSVEVQSNFCAMAQAPPANFSAFIFNLPPELIIVDGDGQQADVGSTVSIAAGILNGCGRGRDAGRGVQPIGCGNRIDFVVASGSATFSNGARSITTFTDRDDVSRVDVRLGPAPGPVTIQASTNFGGKGPDQTVEFNLVATAPRTLTIISGNDQVGRPGQRGQPLVVALAESGRPVVGETISFGVAFGPNLILDAPTATTDSQGRAQIGFTFPQALGESIVEARTAGGDSVRFRVVNQLGGLTLLSGENQVGPVGGTTAQPVIFQVLNPNGTPAVGERVDFQIVLGDATVTPAFAGADTNGTVRANVRFGPNAGTVRLQASAFGGQSVVTVSLSSTPISLGIASGDGQTAPINTRLPQPLVVQITQPPAGQKTLAGVVVNWAVLQGGGTLASPTSTTDAQGRASNEWTMGPTPGPARARASITGVGEVQFTATATGAPVLSGVTVEIASGNNQSLPTATDSAPLVIRVRRPDGTPVEGVPVQWAPVVAGRVSVSPAQSSTNANGEASTIARVLLPGPQQVAATLPTVQNAPSFVFTLNGGVQNVPGLAEDERNVGAAIDAACPALAALPGTSLNAAQQDLLAQCSAIVAAGGDPGRVDAALDQILADETAAQADAALLAIASQFDNLKARLAALRSGTQGKSFGGLALATRDGVLPLSFLPSSILADEDSSGGGGDDAGDAFSRWGFFATGTLGRGQRDERDNTPGFDLDTLGLTAGVDYRFSDSWIAGVALGYHDSATEVDAGQGTLDVKGYSLSAYTTWYRDAWYVDAVLNVGRNEFDLDRRVRYSIGSLSVDQRASASPDGDQTSFAFSVGRDFNRGALTFGPYFRTTWSQLSFDSFTERMSNPNAPGAGLALEVDGRDLESLEAVLGGKLTFAHSTSWGILMPHVSVEWLHEFEDDPIDIASRFAADPTRTTFVVPGDEIDRDYFNLGLGLSGVFANGRSAFVYYERRMGQADFSQDSLAIGVRIEF